MASGVDLPYNLIILHSPVDNRLVQPIRTTLHTNDFTLACRDPGTDLRKDELIASSQLVVVCLSQAYAQSSVYTEYLNYITLYLKRVIVLRFDSTLPEPKLKAMTRRLVNFQKVVDPMSDEFTKAVDKLMNCIHTLLSECPESPEEPLSPNSKIQFSSSVPQETNSSTNSSLKTVLPENTSGTVKTLDVTKFNSVQKSPANEAALDAATNKITNFDSATNDTSNIDNEETMSKPLKDLPGLVALSKLLDSNPNRITQLATCYDFSPTDLNFIREGTHPGSETPALSFFRFLESSNPEATIGELRRLLASRRSTSSKALAAINMYSDEQLLTDVSWLDMKALCSSGFEWQYVAQCFGHAEQIREFEIPEGSRMSSSRFEVLFDMICAQFPEQTVGDFVEKLRRLGFGDLVAAVVRNIEEHGFMRNDDEEYLDLR